MSDLQMASYEIVDGWFSIEMKELAPKESEGGLKEMPPLPPLPPLPQPEKPKETQQQLYEFDESKLIELDPIDDEMLETDIVKILNDLF